MLENVVKLIESSDKHRRVLIWRTREGAFRFVEQVRYDIDLPTSRDAERERWASLAVEGAICGTAAEAEREARATIEWLRHGPSEQGHSDE